MYLAAAALAFGAAQGKAAAQEPETRVEQEIVVTGTRIRNPELRASNPIVSALAEAIQNSGQTNLGEYLLELPALTGSLEALDTSGSAAPVGYTGLNLLNLRNLGVERTLVLVNGRRHVPSAPGTAAVDINTIPTDLVDRVEVLTGGASAIYGADGVSGVVNFVLQDDFDGLRTRAQYGAPEDGGAETAFFSVIAGRNFGDQANVTASVEYERREGLQTLDRPFGRRGLYKNPDDADDDPAVPDRVLLGDVRYYDSNPGGAIDVDFDGVPEFLSDGSPWDPGVFVPDFYQQGGSGTPVYGYNRDLLADTSRFTVNLFGRYALSPAARLFGEAKYVRTESQSFSQPTFDFFLPQSLENPFVPAGLRAALEAAGASEFLVSRDNFDLGVRGEDIRRVTTRLVAGVDGRINANTTYEVSATFGETRVDDLRRNNRLNDRFYAAIDVVTDPATGAPVCRSTLDPSVVSPGSLLDEAPIPPTTFTPGPGGGCVPLNIYGAGSPSPAARAWVMEDTPAEALLQQTVFSAFVTGDLGFWFELPGGAVSYAVGAEYREERSKDLPPAVDRLGVTFGNAIQPTKGDFNVSEAFAEVTAPILANRPFFERLSLDAAVRLSDYSTIGETTTWKVGGIWSPAQDVTFRATVAEAVRAPNVGELFGAQAQDFEFIDDPCDAQALNEGTASRAANCAALLAGLGVADPGGFNDPNSASIPGVVSGNRNLQEEVAETFTVGVVLQPRWLRNFTTSIDFYRIDISDAINQAEAQEIAEECVDQPSLDNPFCPQITREPGVGRITGFTAIPVNVAEFNTEGVDFTVRYRLDPADFGARGDWGTFAFNLVGNKLEKLEFINLPGAPPDDDLGEIDIPEWQATFDLTWDRGPWRVNYGFNYFDETRRFEVEQLQGEPDIAAPENIEYDERFTHDVFARYALNDRVGIYAGINNFTNQEPDPGSSVYPVSPIGRFFFVGFTTNLDR